MSKETALAMVGDQRIETTTALQQRVRAVHEAYKSVMVNGTHYGTIPHTKKPTLLKPGAEMLCTQFRLVPTYDIERTDLPDGHREYGCTCTLTKMDTGQVWAQGVGLCTTMESKYRYRNVWTNGRKTQVKNPDLADAYNTVLKMAKKRALVDATLTATGSSDMFTQDVEDFKEPQAVEAVVEEAPAQAAPQRPARLEPMRELFAEAKQAGVDMPALNAWVPDTYGCDMAELSDDQLGEVADHVRGLIDAALAQEPADGAGDGMAPGDIEF